jgi:signal transduction histidine kinase
VSPTPRASVGPLLAVEGTAFFVVSEGIANLFKHSRATSARVSVVQVADLLLIELADNGVGGVAVDGGTGLRDAIDRVEALGGTPAIESPVGAGTRLNVELPCAS